MKKTITYCDICHEEILEPADGAHYEVLCHPIGERPGSVNFFDVHVKCIKKILRLAKEMETK